MTDKEIQTQMDILFPDKRYSNISGLIFYGKILENAKSHGMKTAEYLQTLGFSRTQTNLLDHAWDVQSLRKLYYDYDISMGDLAALLNRSKQYISSQINAANKSKNQGGWNVELSENELKEVEQLIYNGKLESANDKRSILVLYGRRNIEKKAVLYIAENRIKCVFDAEVIFAKALEAGNFDILFPADFVIFNKVENLWLEQGKQIIDGIKIFSCSKSDYNRIEKQALLHELDVTDYLEIMDFGIQKGRSSVIEKLDAYLVPGKEKVIRISSHDPFYKVLTSTARRKGYSGIRDFVESQGYVYETYSKGGLEVPLSRSERARERTIARFKKHIVAGTENIVHIKSSDPDYPFFTSKAHVQGYSGLKELAEAHGFVYESKRDILVRNNLKDDENKSGLYSDISANRTETYLNIIRERYLVRDNQVYISSYDPFFAIIRGYCKSIQQSLDMFLRENGYERIRRVYDLPAEYEPYDYSDDLINKLEENWSDDKLTKVLADIAISETVTISYESNIYSILKRKAAINDMTVAEFVEGLGYVFIGTHNKISYSSYEEEAEEEFASSQIDILKDIEAEYEKIEILAYKIKRNRSLVKVLKILYKGKCQVCAEGEVPAIYDDKGNLYSEVHHINPVSSATGDSDIKELDSYKNAIVLCPFHHAYVHYQNGGGFVLEKDKENNLILDNHKGNVLPIRLNYHLKKE